MKFTIKTLLGVTAAVACLFAGSEFIRIADYNYYRIPVELLSILMVGLLLVAVADYSSGRKTPYWVAFLALFLLIAVSRLTFSGVLQGVYGRLALFNYLLTPIPSDTDTAERSGSRFEFIDLFSILVIAHLAGVLARYFSSHDKVARENSQVR